MISELYINEARNIKQEFNRIFQLITETEQNTIKEACNILLAEKETLEKIKNREIVITDKDEFAERIMKSLTIVDDETKKMEKPILDLNNKMEELKKRETELWDKIKAAYPTLTDEQIVSYIEPHL